MSTLTLSQAQTLLQAALASAREHGFKPMGVVVVALGGGRRLANDAVDARVGLSQILPLGSAVQAGQPLLRLHAADAAAAQAARAAVLAALRIAEPGVAAAPPGPVLIETVLAEAA